MTLPPLLPLGLFMGSILMLAMYGLAASGHFPAEHRKEGLRTAGGTVVLWGTLLLSAAVTLAAVLGAYGHLPWPAAIIGGGLMLLVAPLVLQIFSDRFVDGAAGLVLLAGGAAAMAGTLVTM